MSNHTYRFNATMLAEKTILRALKKLNIFKITI